MKFFDVFDYSKSIGVDPGLFLTGVFGAVLNLNTKNGLNVWENLSTLITGGLVTNYLTPLVCSYFSVFNSLQYSIAFLIGYSGLKAMEYVLQVVHEFIQSRIK